MWNMQLAGLGFGPTANEEVMDGCRQHASVCGTVVCMRAISWQELCEDKNPASSSSPLSQWECSPQPPSEWITRTKSPGCSECCNRRASVGLGSRCHMVRRVQAGKLCGTVAGLPWPQESRGEGKWCRGVGGDQQSQWALKWKGWLQRFHAIVRHDKYIYLEAINGGRWRWSERFSKWNICRVLVGQSSDLSASIVFNLTKHHPLNQQDLLSFPGKQDCNDCVFQERCTLPNPRESLQRSPCMSSSKMYECNSAVKTKS